MNAQAVADVLPHRVPPTFVWPTVSAARWAVCFAAGMLAVPSGNTWAWLCLVPFGVHTWRALRAGERYIAARVKLDFERRHIGGTETTSLPDTVSS